MSQTYTTECVYNVLLLRSCPGVCFYDFCDFIEPNDPVWPIKAGEPNDVHRQRNSF